MTTDKNVSCVLNSPGGDKRKAHLSDQNCHYRHVGKTTKMLCILLTFMWNVNELMIAEGVENLKCNKSHNFLVMKSLNHRLKTSKTAKS